MKQVKVWCVCVLVFTSVILHICILFTASESDSTEEPVVGNVNKFAVVPPGYAGKPKKGHLIFDACFESGKSHLTCMVLKLLKFACIILYM